MIYVFLFLLYAGALWGQTTCDGTPQWATCDLTFELEGGENADSVELRGEFRSPDQKTFLLTAFHDEARKLVFRWAATEAGEWNYKLTSNSARLNGKLGKISAAPSSAPGFVRVANIHHFATENNQPHLWMSAPFENFLQGTRAEFDARLATAVKEKFTHMRVAIGRTANMQEAADRIKAINARGLVADLLLVDLRAGTSPAYLGDIVARFAPFNLTWMGLPPFEALEGGKPMVKQFGTLLAKLDPYGHPRTSMAEASGAGLTGDGWMHLFSYGRVDPNIGAVEHQIYQAPSINTGIQSMNDLWNASMNGQYPASGSGAYMTYWFDYLSASRYWELEPYFDLDGGRALALEDVEYLVWIEKPGPIEVTVEDHGYDVEWMNPLTGDRIKGKEYKGRKFTGEPPDKSHPWVLRISREGRKEGMLKSYKFESRRVPVQEAEITPKGTPFEVELPPEGDLKVNAAIPFSLKILRPTRATRSLLVEWAAEVVVDGRGFQILGTGKDGTLRIPTTLAVKYPAVLSLRVGIVNANGKLYVIDRVYRLVE